MKKFICIIPLITFGCLPLLAAAVAPGTIPGAADVGLPESPINTASGALRVIASIVRWVYILFFIIAVLFILFAAFNYLSGASHPEKIKASHDQIIYAAIAIAVALLAVGASAIIGNFLSVGR